jgi:hypothetical protein
MADTTESNTEYMLTTVDNPYNPFTNFDEWLVYDTSMGHNSTGFLDRVAHVSPDLSEPDQALAIRDAIDYIVQENVSGVWRKVSKESAKQFGLE